MFLLTSFSLLFCHIFVFSPPIQAAMSPSELNTQFQLNLVKDTIRSISLSLLDVDVQRLNDIERIVNGVADLRAEHFQDCQSSISDIKANLKIISAHLLRVDSIPPHTYPATTAPSGLGLSFGPWISSTRAPPCQDASSSARQRPSSPATPSPTQPQPEPPRPTQPQPEFPRPTLPQPELSSPATSSSGQPHPTSSSPANSSPASSSPVTSSPATSSPTTSSPAQPQPDPLSPATTSPDLLSLRSGPPELSTPPLTVRPTRIWLPWAQRRTQRDKRSQRDFLKIHNITRLCNTLNDYFYYDVADNSGVVLAINQIYYTVKEISCRVFHDWESNRSDYLASESMLWEIFDQIRQHQDFLHKQLFEISTTIASLQSEIN